MNLAGWIVMIIAVSFVLILCGFCFYKILTEKPKDLPSPIDIDTQDREES